MLKKKERLKKEQIGFVLKNGRGFYMKAINFYFLKNHKLFCRFAILIKKQQKLKAVKRNLIKRWVRVCFKIFFYNKDQKRGLDLVLLIKTKELSFEIIKEEFLKFKNTIKL